jgi:hypothetical protein
LRKATAKKKNVEPGAGTESAAITGVTAEERRQLIATTAYFRAERRGFAPGSEMEDWFEAEAEIDKMLGKPDEGQSNQSKDS